MAKDIIKSIVAVAVTVVSLSLAACLLYKILLPPEMSAAAGKDTGGTGYEEPGGGSAGGGGDGEGEDIGDDENADDGESGEGAEGDEEYVYDRTTPLVFVDAGHGGEDGGCTEDGIYEKDINLSVAKLVGEKLAEAGFGVVMSRTNDTYVTKDDRVKMANAARADIFVSIHQNFSDDKGVSGMEVWYDGEDEDGGGRRLAMLVSQQAAGSTLAFEREVRGDVDFYVTKNSKMPACLVEAGFLSNKAEREKLVSAEYQEKLASGIVQGITYYFHPKTLYLTFDDGPSEKNTPVVLDILKKRGIKATFFLVGKYVKLHPEIVKRIADEGHTIGIHSYSHDYGPIYASVEAFVADFERAHEAVYEASGVDARIFRFPGGSINRFNKDTRAGIIAAMEAMGYDYFDWNASFEDAAAGATAERIFGDAVRTAHKQDNPVMLAHDTVPATAAVLEEVLDALPEYEVRPITDDVAPAHF